MTTDELRRFKKDGYAGPFDLYDADTIQRDYREVRAQCSIDRMPSMIWVIRVYLQATIGIWTSTSSAHIYSGKRLQRDAGHTRTGRHLLAVEMFPSIQVTKHRLASSGHVCPCVGRSANSVAHSPGIWRSITAWTAITDATKRMVASVHPGYSRGNVLR